MIISQHTSVGIMFDDKVQVLLILSQLPERWQGSVFAVSNFAGKKKLKLSEVVSLNLTKELKRKSTDSVLLVQIQPSMSSKEVEVRKKVIRTGTEIDLIKKVDQSLQCDLLKVNAGIVVGHATWLQAASCKAPKNDKNEHSAHIVHDALILLWTIMLSHWY